MKILAAAVILLTMLGPALGAENLRPDPNLDSSSDSQDGPSSPAMAWRVASQPASRRT
jgi:hypothetical protein